MTEGRDIEGIVETLEVLADWSALDGCKREVQALIADWRAKKAEIERLNKSIDQLERERFDLSCRLARSGEEKEELKRES